MSKNLNKNFNVEIFSCVWQTMKIKYAKFFNT